MKYIFLFLLSFISIIGNAQDLKEVRELYPNAVENFENTTKLDAELQTVNNTEKPVLIAYKGAVKTLKAKFTKSKSDKKEFFKEGVALIEDSVIADPDNIEVRYLRLSVQENSPRFLGYHKNIEAYKEFILKNYTNTSPKELKSVIKDFVMKSQNFSESEKTELKLS